MEEAVGGHMSVEASESMSEVWTRWQGHVINSAFPLGRYLGSSDHSGVFLTRSAEHSAADLAIKLVPTNRALAELLLPRWKRAAGLLHPHLLELVEWGGCQLEGLPYLYVVMEYADQTLAQLLQHRALTEDEARELLGPTLEALAFLHRQGFVQGQLKPANILVVGDQVKLASDTARRVGEGAISTHALSAYDPPEGRQGSTSPGADIWALGVTLCEALARRPPTGSGDSREQLSPPPELAGAFRDIVARCLSNNPQARPGVAELADWAARKPAAPAVVEPPAAEASEPPALETSEPPKVQAPEPAKPQPSEPAKPERPLPALARSEPVELAGSPAPRKDEPASAMTPATAGATPARARTPLLVMAGTIVALALIWVAARTLGGRPAESRHPVAAPAQTAPQASPPVAPIAPSSSPTAGRGDASAATVVHQVIPDVPGHARQTIHGHIKVWVRVVVEQDGSVLAAAPDRSGSSRYFERLAVEAARKWTFAPAATAGRRILQVQFDFSREGTTGRAVALR
jgi:TonB family protein